MDQPTSPIPQLPSDWRDRLINVWARLRLGDMGLQIEKDARRQRVTEHAIGQAYRKAGMAPPPLDDDLSVQVGDTVNNYQAPAGGGGNALKTLGLVGAGAAASLFGPPLYEAITTPRAAVAEPSEGLTDAPPFSDRDTQYEFRIVPELTGER